MRSFIGQCLLEKNENPAKKKKNKTNCLCYAGKCDQFKLKILDTRGNTGSLD